MGIQRKEVIFRFARSQGLGFLEKKKPLRASKGQFSSERLSEAFPPLVLHLRSSSRGISLRTLKKIMIKCC